MKILNTLLALSCVGLLASGASGATLTFNNDTDITAASNSGADANGLRGTVTCTLDCSGMYYNAGTYGFGAVGEVFDGPTNSGDANEAAWVNSVLGTSFTGTDVGADYQDNGNPFTTAALYVIMKIGNSPDYLLISNDSGVVQTYSFFQAAGSKGELSHSFGLGTPVSTVPLPATGLLLVAGLGGLAALRRKRPH